jgi:fructokinase
MKTHRPILIFGESLIDDFPDAPVVGGAPLNVARTLGFFNAQPLMLTRIGDDVTGQQIIADMQRFQLICDGVQIDTKHPTGRVIVHLAPDGDRTRHQFEILDHQAYDYMQAEDCIAAVQKYFPNHDDGILYFGTLAQRQPDSRAALQSLLAHSDALRYLDLNLRKNQYDTEIVIASLHAADIVKLNEEEFSVILSLEQSGAPDTDRVAMTEQLRSLLDRFELQAIILTLGERGYLFIDRNNSVLSSGTLRYPVEIQDTVGSGDAFSAIFLLGMQQGWSLATSLSRAHEFATAICAVRGAIGDDRFYHHWQQRWIKHDQQHNQHTGVTL